MRETVIPAAFAAVVLLGTANASWSDETDLAKHVAGAKKSGYVFAAPETRQMMDDDFNNPGFLWIQKGEALWHQPDGHGAKSCEACHQDVRQTMKGVAASYPKYEKTLGRVVDLEQRINLCRTVHMKAQPLQWESDELLALTALVKLQSRGEPVHVSRDGPAQPFWERGKGFYYQRRGQLDLSCANCHETNQGRHLRTEVLSQGQSNGFPLYRLKWQGFGSVQRRFAGCNEEIRALAYPLGSEEYVNLELYVAWRGNGLPIETPAVRK